MAGLEAGVALDIGRRMDLISNELKFSAMARGARDIFVSLCEALFRRHARWPKSDAATAKV
jgi:hypothetical protein